jgi:hypothetical protein
VLSWQHPDTKLWQAFPRTTAVSSEARHHLNNYASRYRQAAAAGAWDVAKTAAIIMRSQQDTDIGLSECLYAEGYAREKLGYLRLAAACYGMAVWLTGHPKARRRLEMLPS